MLISFIFFITIAIVEGYLIPKLKPTSKFTKWWRNNIIGTLEEYGD